MPHDKNGQVLEVGDIVSAQFEVVAIQKSEEYCNATLRTVELMPPYTDEVMGKSTVTMNTKQVVKVEPAPSGPCSSED